MTDNAEYDVLVIGACGFLGSQIVSAGTERGLSVLAVDRPGTDPFRLQHYAPDCVRADFDITASIEALTAMLGRARAVINCAAYGVDYRQRDLETALQVNVLASVNLLKAAAATHTRMVHVGTAYEYGPSSAVQCESDCLAPRGIYGVSKAAGTLALLDAGATLGADIVVMRPFGMYGPLEGTHKLIPLVMRSQMAGEPLNLTPGEQIRDYVYVGDVARACLDAACAERFPSGRILNVCSGVELTLRAFVEAAAKAAGDKLNLLHWGTHPYREDEVMRILGNNGEIRKVLGWTPTVTLHDGMERTALAERERLARETAGR